MKDEMTTRFLSERPQVRILAGALSFLAKHSESHCDSVAPDEPISRDVDARQLQQQLQSEMPGRRTAQRLAAFKSGTGKYCRVPPGSPPDDVITFRYVDGVPTPFHNGRLLPAPPKPTEEQVEEMLGRLFYAGHHLYLVEVVGVCVKVGITDDPDTRLAAHRAQARKLGRSVGRVWMSPRHAEAKLNERILRGCSRTEYLRGDFNALVERAGQLEMTTAGDQ